MTTENLRQGGIWLFEKVLGCVEYVGSIVATFLGLNESKYQYVIDQMSEEDWRIAREIQAKKECLESRDQEIPVDSIVVQVMESQPLQADK